MWKRYFVLSFAGHPPALTSREATPLCCISGLCPAHPSCGPARRGWSDELTRPAARTFARSGPDVPSRSGLGRRPANRAQPPLPSTCSRCTTKSSAASLSLVCLLNPRVIRPPPLPYHSFPSDHLFLHLPRHPRRLPHSSFLIPHPPTHTQPTPITAPPDTTK